MGSPSLPSSKRSSGHWPIFWCSTSKRRRMARNDADQIERNQNDSNLKDARGDDAVRDIFLSHSGKQKPFVERLYDELERTNQTVFFDQHTLPKGSRFPSRIKRAARGCKLGVVVLSEEFMTSKWPMIELEILVSQSKKLASEGSGLELHVLPLFFRLSPDDLKSPTKLSKWRPEWEKLGGADGAKQWEQAVKDLRAFNGEVYVQGTSEGAYIKRVVQRICNLVPSPVLYDCPWVQGRSRLAQEIESKFERLDASRAGKVGLHGVGGAGKTTLCKVMVNHYSPQFCGRSFLLEFPSPGNRDMPDLILQCKKALDKLTDASDKHLLSDTNHFDQVVQLMKRRVGRYDVFLAIDNVWEKFLAEAKRVLGVGFSANSKILVTSRSEGVLKDLLRGPVSNVIVDPIPALEREEAFNIFQESFEQDDLGNLIDKKQMREVLGECTFSGSYHALALKALGNYLKRVCINENSKEEIKHQLSCALKEISCKDLSEVEEVIRLSYSSLPEPKQHMFLDIAVYLLKFWTDKTFFVVQKWVSWVNWQSPRSQTTKLMNDLSFDGVIQIEECGDGQKAVGLHDLYYEFALREIASSPRFWVHDITKQSVEKIESEELAIVILNGGRLGSGLFEKLQQCACPKLKLLDAADLETRSGIRINSMPCLSVLTLDNIMLIESACQNPTTSSGSHSEKESGSGSQVVEELAGLDALSNLRTLRVSRCGWLRRLDGLSCLVQLQELYLADCEWLRNLPDMRHLTCLQTLDLFGTKAVEEVGGLPSTLENVAVSECDSLKRMPDLSSLTRLKSLTLVANDAMEEVGGDYCCSSLDDATIENCWRLRSCPRLDKCKHLKSLSTDCALVTCSSVQKVPNLPTGLEKLSIRDELSLIRMIDVGFLPNLRYLSFHDCEILEEVAGLSAHRSLFSLSIKRCPSLVDLSIKQCPSLVYLSIKQCPRLEALDLGCPSLVDLSIKQCLRLIRLDLGCPTLKEVLVEDCEALKQVVWSSETLPTLQEFRVQGPNSLQQENVSLPLRSVLQM